MKIDKRKITFASKIRCLIDSERDKFLAQASLKSLKGIIPDSVKNQQSLLACAFNAFVANISNKNGAMVDTKSSIDIYQKFINTPINKNHERVGSFGHIVSAGFSKFDINYANGAGSELLEEKDVKDLTEPFNVCLGGVLYKLYDSKLIEYIEESNDPNSDHYMDISASFELLFDEFYLAVGSKYLQDCEIIQDEKKIGELSKYLLDEGGTGKTPDGKIVSRLIIGEIIPAGIGLTDSPAAELAGIVVDSEKAKISIKSSENGDISEKDTISTNGEIDKYSEIRQKYKNIILPKPIDDLIEGFKDVEKFGSSVAGHIDQLYGHLLYKKDKNNINSEEIVRMIEDIAIKPLVKEIQNLKNLQKIENSNSQSQNLDVKASNNIKIDKIMILKTRKDITDEALKEANASQVISVIDSEIEKISDEFIKEKNKVDTELKASSDKIADLEKKSKETEEKLTKASEDLQKLVKANEDREQEEIFNTRMNYFDSEYDLSEEKYRNVVAKKIKAAKSEDEYKDAKEEIELILAAKKKSNKVFDKKSGKWVDKEEMDKMHKDMKDTKASVEKADITLTVDIDNVVDNVIDNGEKTKTTVAATTTPTETQTDKWAKAFGEEGWEINKRSFRK